MDIFLRKNRLDTVQVQVQVLVVLVVQEVLYLYCINGTAEYTDLYGIQYRTCTCTSVLYFGSSTSSTDDGKIHFIVMLDEVHIQGRL